MSKVLSETAAPRDAKVADIVTTALSSTEALTGTLGFAQKAMYVGAGMAIESYSRTGSIKPKLFGGA